LLKYLKWLSLTFSRVVTYYSAASHGGPLELEYAWVFTPDEFVYCSIDYTDRIREFSPRGGSVERQDDALVRMLKHLEIESTGYFAPHRSGFDWTPFAIPSDVALAEFITEDD